MTVSNGNAEQPTAQTPRGNSSPNRVEVSGEARQGAPASNAPGQESSNGQSKEAREEQLATTRTLPAARARAAASSYGPASCVRCPSAACLWRRIPEHSADPPET